ncbi:MAG: PTS sugar transporter subunit IIA [Desulfurococcaceae archaeon]|jgi:PTS system ascorbate-specific IIA component
MENEELNLLEALDNRTLVTGSVKDWIEAIRLAGGLLAIDRVVEDKYIEAMVNVTRELDPYAVIAPRIAMPHARPEDSAHSVGLSTLVIKKEVNFGSPNDLVNVVIGFAAVDKPSHLKMLKELASLLSIPSFIEELTSVRYSFEIKEIIRKYFNGVKRNITE